MTSLAPAPLNWDALPSPCRCQSSAVVTPRERQLVIWLASGQSAVAIGAMLGISPKTIEKHKDNIAKRLGTHSLVQALAVLVHRGVIAPDELADAEPQLKRVPHGC